MIVIQEKLLSKIGGKKWIRWVDRLFDTSMDKCIRNLWSWEKRWLGYERVSFGVQNNVALLADFAGNVKIVKRKKKCGTENQGNEEPM